MKTKNKVILTIFSVVLLTVASIASVTQAAYAATKASVFTLQDTKGQLYDLVKIQDRPMHILYFLDIESRSNQEGLLNLDQLAKNYKDANLSVWAITVSPKVKVLDFLSKTRLSFPILLDNAGVSENYEAGIILPSIIILGPNTTILDTFQGAGKSMEIMLVKLAERNLQQQPQLAKAIGNVLEQKNPNNIKAKTLKGYAAFKEGHLDEAEAAFRDIAKNNDEILGKEGLSAVLAKNGKNKEAYKLVQEVIKKAPNRSYAHKIKGDILYRQNKTTEAVKEYELSVENTEAESFQKSISYNQLGRHYASIGEFEKSRQLYNQALEIDPYYIEATSNKGLTYANENNYDQALKIYRKALVLGGRDMFVNVLAKRASQMIQIEQNAEKKEEMNKLIKNLAARYKDQKTNQSKNKDEWTSRPMVMTFIDFKEKGGLAERDGYANVLLSELGNALTNSGRTKVVERIVIEKLLEELNLGTSELANQETALKLGKVFAAQMIATGSLYHMPNVTLLNMRLIDTETSLISQVITKQLSSYNSLEKDLKEIHREILKTIIKKHPLKGYVVKNQTKNVIINLGARQGVLLGTQFDVIEQSEPITYKGKVLQSSAKTVANLEIIQVEEDFSYAKIIKSERNINQDDKVVEKIINLLAMGTN